MGSRLRFSAWWLVLAIVAPSVALGAGDLDPTFGVGGKVVTSLNGGGAGKLVVQADGKIVVAGSTVVDPSNYSDSLLVRYGADGALDTTFGTGGVVVTSIGTATDWLGAITQQPDGKLVAAGTAQDEGDHLAGLVVRRLSGGKPDASFGTGGAVRTPLGSAGGVFTSVLVQPDATIVAAGNSSGAVARGVVARYLADGTPDATFGAGGVATTTFGSLGYVDLVRQPDGKLVAGGYASLGLSDVCVVARFETDGSADTSFGTNGLAWVTQPVPPNGASCTAVGLQSDGKIVMVGSVRQNGGTPNSRGVLYRFLPDGQLDGTFGSGGILEINVGVADYTLDVIVQPNDGLVVMGTTWTGSRYDVLLLRYLADGTLDPDFGAGGIVTTDVQSGDDQVFAGERQSDAKLVVVGASYDVGRRQDIIVLRYVGEGSAPSTTTGPSTSTTSSTGPIGTSSSTSTHTTTSTTSHSTSTASSTSTTTSTSSSTSTSTSLPGCSCANPCEICSAELGCHVPDVAGCATALPRKATLVLKNDPSPTRDQLTWKWKGAAEVGRGDFGDPTTSAAYALCVIDRPAGTPDAKLDASVVAGGDCGGRPCWRTVKGGFRYADSSAAQHGIRAIQLKSGDAGRAKASVKAKGPNLAMPALGLSTPVTARLVRIGTPACWEASFGAPSRNDAALFKARSD